MNKAPDAVVDENVVLFPSSRHIPLEAEGPDPLEELLNEFSEIEGDWEEEAPLEELSANSLDISSMDLNHRLDYLVEIQERMSFLLEELDPYLSKKES